MAIVQNIATEEGDVIEVHTSVPAVGIVALSSFIDTTSEVEGTFLREFRYSVDGGVTYSSWIELTNAALQAIDLSAISVFYAQYRYTVQVLNEDEELEWQDITLYGDSGYPDDGPIYDKSVFSQYFGAFDVRVLTWAMNVLEKLYVKGIVAEFLERRKGDNDSHYLEFWKPICIFFAYIVMLAREFEFFHNNASLANKYLLNKGHFTCGHEQLDDLIIIITNLLRVRAQRGTTQMFSQDLLDYEIDGELLRLICFNGAIDYFKYGNAQSKYVGFWGDFGSPEYKGCYGRVDLNSSYEDVDDIEDLTKYPLLEGGYISIAESGDKSVMLIDSVAAGEISGIGEVDLTKKITIDPTLNFEISFWVSGDSLDENITFGVLGLDSGGNQLQFENIVTSSDTNYFFERKSLNQVDKFYFVRGIVYNKDHALLTAPQARLNIGFGQNLRFHEDTTHIIPYIVLDNSDSVSESNSIQIWNVKVSPASTQESIAYSDNRFFTQIICKNRNATYNTEDLVSIMRKYFVPYNTSFLLKNINSSQEI